MAWFGKKAPRNPVAEFSKIVEGQIAEARILLADVKEFDPRRSKHAKLVRTILVIAGNIPETRMADARSCGWNESKYKKFVVKAWSEASAQGHSHAQGIYFGGTLVIEWNAMAGQPEEFRVVRLGNWCEELFASVLEIRQDVERRAHEEHEHLARTKTEYEANRFKPLD